jgi:hypothetical protein
MIGFLFFLGVLSLAVILFIDYLFAKYMEDEHVK